MVRLPEQVRSAVEDEWIPCLIVAEERWGKLFRMLHGSPFYAYDLQVGFPDGTTVPYKMIMGTAAFHVLPMLMSGDGTQDGRLLAEAVVV